MLATCLILFSLFFSINSFSNEKDLNGAVFIIGDEINEAVVTLRSDHQLDLQMNDSSEYEDIEFCKTDKTTYDLRETSNTFLMNSDTKVISISAKVYCYNKNPHEKFFNLRLEIPYLPKKEKNIRGAFLIKSSKGQEILKNIQANIKLDLSGLDSPL